ncbi:MAG TPA: histidinol dehydrogenase, partial [Holophaga sp.]|nr:histidinol dehydrogenase [Holophaga sp.]
MASLARDAEIERDTEAAVGRILADVRQEGLTAVFRYTEAFDRVSLSTDSFRLPREVMLDALARLRREQAQLIHDLEGMAEGIRRFAEAQRDVLADVD